MMYHSKLTAQFHDPDRDESLYKEFAAKRRTAKKELLQKYKNQTVKP